MRGETRNAKAVMPCLLYFNPRSRKGNDLNATSMACMSRIFQSTFPQGERQGPLKGSAQFLYFNPRSRKGNDYVQYQSFETIASISIHVPARGTTESERLAYLFYQIFQSTFPQGERLACVTSSSQVLSISIHVPARGTTMLTDQDKADLSFQSTFPQGERLSLIFLLFQQLLFQSTFPQGERRDSRERCMEIVKISIHVPARGTTTPPIPKSGYRIISIHVPARGTTNRLGHIPITHLHFNPRSRKGNDYNRSITRSKNIYFNPRSRKGNDNGNDSF